MDSIPEIPFALAHEAVRLVRENSKAAFLVRKTMVTNHRRLLTFIRSMQDRLICPTHKDLALVCGLSVYAMCLRIFDQKLPPVSKTTLQMMNRQRALDPQKWSSQTIHKLTVDNPRVYHQLAVLAQPTAIAWSEVMQSGVGVYSLIQNQLEVNAIESQWTSIRDAFRRSI